LCVKPEHRVFRQFTQVFFYRRRSSEDHTDSRVGRVDELHVESAAPGSIASCDCIGIPTVSPIVGCFVSDVSQTRTEPVLRCDTSNGNMHRFAGKQFLGASGNTCQTETTLFEFINLPGRIDWSGCRRRSGLLCIERPC